LLLENELAFQLMMSSERFVSPWAKVIEVAQNFQIIGD
jgi:hypothetical protein